jgi:hypothetical protein
MRKLSNHAVGLAQVFLEDARCRRELLDFDGKNGS